MEHLFLIAEFYGFLLVFPYMSHFFVGKSPHVTVMTDVCFGLSFRYLMSGAFAVTK